MIVTMVVVMMMMMMWDYGDGVNCGLFIAMQHDACALRRLLLVSLCWPTFVTGPRLHVLPDVRKTEDGPRA